MARSDKKPQIQKFREAARAAECADDEGNFNRNLKAVGKHKPKDPKPESGTERKLKKPP
jgi:hypothetical protein